MSQPAHKRLVAIDLLRGLAVMVVVLSHLPLSWADLGAHPTASQTMPPGLRIALEYGRVGVHLFLIISGFCIHLAWSRAGDLTKAPAFGAFWRKRLHRLYPSYFVALLGTLAIGFVLNAVMRDSDANVGAMFGYESTIALLIDLGLLLVLAQNVTIASHRVGNGPFWSLALEEQLYMLYFGLLAVRRTLGWRRVWIMTLTVTLLWRAAWWQYESSLPNAWLGIGPSRWFEWTLGAYAVEAYHGHVTLPKWASHPAAFLGFFALALFSTPATGTWTAPSVLVVVRDPLWGLAFFVLVNALCRLDLTESARARWAMRIAALGTISYSVYLVHYPLMVLVTRLAVIAGVDSLALLVAMRFCIAFIGGVVFYKVVEQRFLPARAPARDTPEGVPVPA